VNEYVKHIVGERKTAINVFFIVLPSAVVANILMRVLVQESLSIWIYVVLVSALLLLFCRFYQILKVKIFEHVIVDEIIFDMKNQKVLINLNSRRELEIINEIYNGILQKEEMRIANTSPKELPNYSELVLDIFELFVITIIERSQIGVQTTKYSYSFNPGNNSRQISFRELPAELRQKNMIYKRLGEELNKIPQTIVDLPFWLPFNSELEYCIDGKVENLRKIKINNKFGKLEVALGRGSFGYKETGKLYYLPYVRFKFESNPLMVPSKNYNQALAWAVFVLEKLRLDLSKFCEVKEKNA
jgi:hypothetical protein